MEESEEMSIRTAAQQSDEPRIAGEGGFTGGETAWMPGAGP